ncbi:vesicle-associated membrane protein 1-like [Carcharodon carcharias]|uniref:vesicle-associated membrane protein 1-like n=1 Tax=Carcharodon carcharias TaxID=13397 RepID=UPI001B7DD968|nr:vesicle-associated membrane protein 1-like [Carcharodon carcharias]
MGTNNSDIIIKLQKETDEVLEVMCANTDKVKERGEKLEVLDDRAMQLLESGKVFQKTAKEVAKQERFKNMKWKIILGVTFGLVALIIIIVIVCFILSSKPKDSVTPSTTEKTVNGQ